MSSKDYILPDTCYVFDYVVLDKIPKCAQKKFIEICQGYTALHKESKPTLKSLAYAFSVLTKEKDSITDKYEKTAYRVVNRSRFYQKLQQEAMEEFKSSTMTMLYAVSWSSSQIIFRTPLLLEQIILADHILRHKEKVPMLGRLSKLRCATRKKLGLEKDEWVGF